MIKFIFVLLFSSLILIKWEFFFWLINGVLCVLGLILFFYRLNFTNFLIFSSTLVIDIVTYSLVILRIWVSLLILYSSFGVYSSKTFRMRFSFTILVLCSILVITFSCNNLLMFYFYFEASLIPTLFIILGWGYQPERLQAGIYFLFYTLTASLPLLLIIVYFIVLGGGVDIFNWDGIKFINYSFYFFIFLTLAFLVKMPIFFTHLWLPKAHVEAPVSGSMILAGVLLKLGGYGFYRVIPLCQGGLKFYGGYFFGLSVLGITYVGLICCRLNDLKALVAYSSVAHMALVICGIFRIYIWGYRGGLIIIIRHGLASSGLFCIVNIYYERRRRRRIYLNRGLILILPIISFLIFILRAANIAAPPTLNLLSEIFLISRMLKFDKLILLLFPIGSYLGAVFTLFMFSFSQHGKSYVGNYSFVYPSFRELHILILHILPVNFLILKPEFFLCLN